VIVVAADGVRLRRARPDDAAFVGDLAAHDDVQPFMSAAAAREPESIRALIEAGEAEPTDRGVFVIELVDEGGSRAGVVMFEVANRRSRIAHLYGLMLAPAFRGRGLATAATRAFVRHLLVDLDFHRVQLECYGFNDRAIRHFERAGFVREGVKRKAYWRHDDWVDGVMFGLLREDLDGEESSLDSRQDERSG
jgi:RimJ/RimL family protein N-acetyltransferase